jgi:4-amino-4-deoxy-L-arabinose transferase-like glycosyltransferase
MRRRLSSPVLKKFGKRSFLLAVLFVLLLSAFFRRRNYSQRFAFGADQGRDALIAHYLAQEKDFPLVGPPSSAGPFSYGPWFYWFLSLPFLFKQDFLLAPWLVVTFFSFLFILVMVLVGYHLEGKGLALISGVLASFSMAEIRVSAHLADVSLVSFFSALTVLAIVLLRKFKKPFYAFLIGFFCSMAVNIHFSAFLFVPILITPFFNDRKKLLTNILLLGLGFFLPFLPLMTVNVQHDWVLFQNMITFFFQGRTEYWLSNRWLTYLCQFWPQQWAEIVGGTKLTSFLFFFFLGVLLFKDFLKKRWKGKMIPLAMAFILQIVLLRFWTGEKQAVWLLFFNPLVILFTAWVVFKVSQKSALLGLFLLSFLMFKSYQNNQEHWNYQNQFKKINLLKEEILSFGPEEKFTFYECSQSGVLRSQTLPLLYLFEIEKKVSINGLPVVISSRQLEGEALLKGKRVANHIFLFEAKNFVPKDCFLIDQKEIYQETVSLNL